MTEQKTPFEIEIAEQAKSIKVAMADCLLAWASIERILSLILEKTGHFNNQSAFVVWDKIIVFRSRIETLDTFIKRTPLEVKIYFIWKKLFSRTNKLSTNRNKIAHSALIQSGIDGNPRNVVLVPFFSMAKFSQEDLVAADIENITSKFKDMIYALSWFQRYMDKNGPELEDLIKTAPKLIGEINLEISKENPSGITHETLTKYLQS